MLNAVGLAPIIGEAPPAPTCAYLVKTTARCLSTTGERSNLEIFGDDWLAPPAPLWMLERRSKNSLALLKRDTRLAERVKPLALAPRF